MSSHTKAPSLQLYIEAVHPHPALEVNGLYANTFYSLHDLFSHPPPWSCFSFLFQFALLHPLFLVSGFGRAAQYVVKEKIKSTKQSSEIAISVTYRLTPCHDCCLNLYLYMHKYTVSFALLIHCLNKNFWIHTQSMSENVPQGHFVFRVGIIIQERNLMSGRSHTFTTDHIFFLFPVDVSNSASKCSRVCQFMYWVSCVDHHEALVVLHSLTRQKSVY